MRKSQLYIAGLLLTVVFVASGLLWQDDVQAAGSEPAPISVEMLLQNDDTPSTSTADHSEFEELQQEFANGPEVTAACLSCHTEASSQLHQTLHWNWTAEYAEVGQQIGKTDDINNFCVAVQSNERRCTSCHIGYGWKNDEFDFTKEEAVDCLVCHDTTGTYKKFPPGAGHPVYEEKEFGGKTWTPPDLAVVAQNVGETSRDTCGACHFNGGGGDGIKHGDLDSSLENPDRSLDVHMASGEGELNFNCATCHNATAHDVSGSRIEMTVVDDLATPSDSNQEYASCIACHDNDPHEEDKLNDHTDRLACQTCHIPTIARGGIPTKTSWDWRDAGLDLEGEEQFGHSTFNKKKGTFEFGMDYVPDYVWFNGLMTQVNTTSVIDPSNIVQINTPQGSMDDPDSRIYPMKIHRGFQPYDPVNNTFVIPHLMPYAGVEDKTAFWKVFEWDIAIEEGMRFAGLDYSGEYDFVETEMYWPIAHMVAPAEDAVQCRQCHDPEGGQMDFAALGYDEIQVDELTWSEDEYPAITENALDEIVSKPSQSSSWMGWLGMIVAVGAISEVTMTRYLTDRKE